MATLRLRAEVRKISHKLATISSSFLVHVVVSALIILAVFVHPPNVFSGDTDTARNYLNTIVSSLSTILALCISIILVAIQMTASNYTHRVLDFYVRLPYNGSLFLIYLVTIMHSFFLMAQIHDPVADPLSPHLQLEMSADLVLVIICFLSLLLYMYAVVQLLKPDRIVALILRDYHRAVARGKWRAALDNIEQICDIAKRAASVSDTVTGTNCLRTMHEVATKLPLPRDTDDPIVAVHQSFLDQWSEIVGVAVKERETGLLLTTLEAMYQQGCLCIEGRAWRTAERVVKAYKQLVLGHLLPEGQGFYVESVVDYLYQLAEQSARTNERGQLFALRTLAVVEKVSAPVFRQGGVELPTFLTHEAVPSMLQRTDETDGAGPLLTAYFRLFKSFIGVAALPDVLVWADWWGRQLEDCIDLRNIGMALARLLAAEAGRKEAERTLEAAWQPLLLEVISGAELFQVPGLDLRVLFDGLFPAHALNSAVLTRR